MQWITPSIALFACMHTEAIMQNVIGLVIMVGVYGVLQVVAYETRETFPRSGLLVGWIVIMCVTIIQALRLLTITMGEEH